MMFVPASTVGTSGAEARQMLVLVDAGLKACSTRFIFREIR